ncbi:hypothetical protein V8J82_06445 [Gymnodinialimonas sp. 2305UL16-5]|uniref:hypothetical protein n=1 Tax=Gymnodinialimonas mytili TaxID=3126503 RepID=UPI0030A7DC40
MRRWPYVYPGKPIETRLHTLCPIEQIAADKRALTLNGDHLAREKAARPRASITLIEQLDRNADIVADQIPLCRKNACKRCWVIHLLTQATCIVCPQSSQAKIKPVRKRIHNVTARWLLCRHDRRHEGRKNAAQNEARQFACLRHPLNSPNSSR